MKQQQKNRAKIQRKNNRSRSRGRANDGEIIFIEKQTLEKRLLNTQSKTVATFHNFIDIILNGYDTILFCVPNKQEQMRMEETNPQEWWKKRDEI